jgi:hypothetical protein
MDTTPIVPEFASSTCTTEDVDRLLGLADQFLEDWAEDAVQGGERDPRYEERQAEWQHIRPLLVAAPRLRDGLKAIVRFSYGSSNAGEKRCGVLASEALAYLDQA